MAKKRKVRTNPLKADPTRTATLRRVFQSFVTRRFKSLKQSVVELVFKEDAFGLKQSTTHPLTGNQGQFRFLTDPQKLVMFRNWLAGQIQNRIIGVTIEQIEEAWWRQFVEDSFRKGAARAFTDTKSLQRALASSPEEQSFLAGTRDEFLRQAFAQPVAPERVKLLVSRVFSELSGVTESMAQVMTRELADGLAQGKSAAQLSRDLSKSVDISRNRAKTIARTEVIRAHAEGQLTAMENLGVEEVGVAVEWSTAEDARVCPRCAPLDGVVFKVEEARGLIPRHPNCRCAHVPANIGESTRGQIRKRSAIEQAIRRSVKADIPKRSKRTIAQQKRLSTWPGATRTIHKRRPKNLV